MNNANGTGLMQPASRQMTFVFFIAYVTGALLIKINPFAPCIPLAAYALLGLFLTKGQRNSERFADSLYYLGFLLTLTALLLALLELPATRDPMAVARALGSGLSASILGLGLRVLVGQFRGTVSDQEEEARESIEEQAAKVRLALERLEKGWDDSVDVLGRLRNELDIFRGDLKQLHTDTLDTARERHKQLLESSAKAAELWEIQTRRLRETLERIDVPPTLVKDAFAKIAAELGATATEVTTGAAKVMESVTAKLAVIGNTSAACSTALQTLAGTLGTAVTACGKITESVGAVASTIKAAGADLGSSLTNVTISTDSLGRAAGTAGKDLAAAGAGAGALTLSLKDAVATLGEAIPILDSLQKSVKAAAEAVEKIEADVKATIGGVVADVKEVGADLQKVREATGELVELARTELARPA